MTGMKEGAGEDPFADDETSSRDPEPAGDDGSGAGSRPAMDIPYKFRRDGVQDGRSRVPLFVQAETKTAEQDALREMEDRFADDDVSLTDLREALVTVGLDHLDEVEDQMEEWGYGMTFE